MRGMSDHVLITEFVRPDDDPMISAPDHATVRRLQYIRGFPAVSVLLPTTPGPRLAGDDAATLRRLAAEATDRLDRDADEAVATGLRDRLRTLVEAAGRIPTEEGLGLYAHADHAEIVRLPMAVGERVVVAETFAAADLVAAFRHAPHYLLLVLGADSTRLFAGAGPRLTERLAGRGARRRADLRRVDQTVQDNVVDPGVPVVLAGDPSLASSFLAVTTAPERIAGTLAPDPAGAGLADLGRAAAQLIAGHRARLERDALAALPAALTEGRAAVGLTEVWPAAIRGEGETLIVEESMPSPARLSGDGLGLRPAPPEGGRGVVADVIGELAWAMTFYGGRVVVVPAGALRAYDGIALILRSTPEPDDAGGAPWTSSL